MRKLRRQDGLFVALGVVAGLGFWVYSRRGPAQPDIRSSDGLLRLLEGSEDDAAVAQGEMEKRYGIDDISKWRAALNSPNGRARGLAIESVGQRRSPEVVKLLTAALEDSDSMVRVNAVQALASQDPALALRPMLAAIKDEDTWVSEHAANKVRELKRKEAVPALIEALRNPDRETGVYALTDLRHLTGQNYRAGKIDSQQRWNAAVGEWERWWAGVRSTWPSSPDAANVQPVNPSRVFPAPDFALTDANGRTVSLKELRGKTVLLNFWAIGCGPCVSEMPGLNVLAARYRDRGLVVVGAECGGVDGTTLRRYAGEHGIAYNLAQGSEALEEAYGHVHDVPVSFLIDAEGRIRYQWDGEREERVFDLAIKRVLTR